MGDRRLSNIFQYIYDRLVTGKKGKRHMETYMCESLLVQGDAVLKENKSRGTRVSPLC